MTVQPLAEYFEALERIKAGRPTKVPKGSKITNDAVALEAGRGKGSIKKSRAVFADLIKTIDEAAEKQSSHSNQQKQQLDKAKSTSDDYRLKFEAAIAREISLLNELYAVKKELAKLTGGKVLPIRGGKGV